MSSVSEENVKLTLCNGARKAQNNFVYFVLVGTNLAWSLEIFQANCLELDKLVTYRAAI